MILCAVSQELPAALAPSEAVLVEEFPVSTEEFPVSTEELLSVEDVPPVFPDEYDELQ
jgi:hypothetical protein